jgi:membrane protein
MARHLLTFAEGKLVEKEKPRGVRGLANLIKRTGQEFIDDDCPSMAAALAFYTVFSMPPLLVIVIAVAGSVFGRSAVEGRIETQIAGLIGPKAAEQAQIMVAKASLSPSISLASILGVLALIFAATSAFVQLQTSLNRAWEVKPDPHANSVKDFVLKRVLSFGMILGIGFLLLVSLALSAGLSAFGDVLPAYLPPFVSTQALRLINIVLSLTVVTALFASLYKVLPDAKVEWRDVITGAIVTAFLFGLGKYLVGLYLGNSSVLNPFGAAGSLALILLWTYYSSMILLMGAEFTQVWARQHGRRIGPEPGAVRVVRQEKQLSPSAVPEVSKID